MCGRFALYAEPEEIVRVFGLEDAPPLDPRYNVAPSQDVNVVRLRGPAGRRELASLRWGLIPSWAGDPSVGFRTINARSETVTVKPSFKESFRIRRCVIPASGFYEWQRVGSRKQPLFIRPRSGPLFGFGGLWDVWEDPEGGEIQSCTILTTPPNEFMSSIHDRMPLILHPDDYEAWIDPDPSNVRYAVRMCRPYPAEELEAHPVSSLVNSPDNDAPECVKPLEPEHPTRQESQLHLDL